ncbi:MAG: NADPH-dependent oxidoreductase [Gammaproteobacteria bacterium]|jgi:FMN reductase [NAD(P)H]|nr:NADPH-dependent oxidoreductase [Gammaproteobacteria bacterium]
MNDTIRTLKAHRSIRRYQDAPVSDAQLAEIIACAQAAPTSINAQGLSVVIVRDLARRARIAALAGGQRWVAEAPVFLAFVVDFHKTSLAGKKAGRPQHVHEGLEGFLTGVLDVGIALGNAMAAAEALGLGCVPIGGIRAHPREMVEVLGLPRLTYPVVGLSVGHPADPSRQKPRMDVRAFRHDEIYDAARLPALVDDYDAVMARYLKEIGREGEGSWSSLTARFYADVPFADVLAVAKEQGFGFDR